jgi:ketosteroid isomerase-like protein
MEPEDPIDGEADSLQPNSAAEEFFSKVNHDFRRPKPSEEAVAAALQAIQAMAGDAALEEDTEVLAENQTTIRKGAECTKCGGVNSESNRFCGFCGATLNSNRPAPEATARTVTSGEQHIHHHHYHHHYFPDGTGERSHTTRGYGLHPATESLSAGESPEHSGTDTILRKLAQEWVLLCNAKRLDELVALYSSDAVLIRPGVPMAHGSAAIKECLQADLDAGLGDVQLEVVDLGTMGNVACLTGVSRMLMPISPANRKERTGKFLFLVRRVDPRWEIVADIWCVDNSNSFRSTPRAGK